MTEIIFDENEDWEKRILCSDGSCIGTIGADGKCKECGKSYESSLSAEKVAEEVRAVVVEEPQQVSTNAAPDEWDKRVLCGDESCIGVIGSDGKCRECGKPL